jgi:hypothetical protein
MGDDQKNKGKAADKTLAMWFIGIALLMVICVAIPAMFPGLSWMHLLFPVGVVAGPAVLLIYDRRLNQGKSPSGDRRTRGNARNEKK